MTNYPPFCEGYTRSPSSSPSNSPTFAPCEDDDMVIEVTVFTDTWSSETSWDIIDTYTGEELAGVDRYDYSDFIRYEHRICYPTNSCLAFEMKDSYGDGIYLPYGYNLTVDDVVLATSFDDAYGDFDFSEFLRFGDGCAPTFSPSARPSTQPSISPTFRPCNEEDENTVRVMVYTDYYSYYSTSWKIIDVENGTDVVGVPLYGYPIRYNLYEHQYCFPSMSCLIFEIQDRYGDGILLPYGYNFTVDDVLLATSYDDTNGDFGYSERVRFGDGCSPTLSPTLSSVPTLSSAPSVSAAPSITPPPKNIFVSYWETPSSWTELPSLGLKETMGEPYKTEYIEQIDFHSYYGIFAGSDRSDDVAACFEARLRFQMTGTYSLCLRSDDGSKLYMNDELIIDLDGLHPDETRCTAIEVTSGTSDIMIEYWERGGYAIMYLLWRTPDSGVYEVIPGSAFVSPEPTISPAPSISSFPSLSPWCTSGQTSIILELKPDSWAHEISWTLTNLESGDNIANATYGYEDDYQYFEYRLCVIANVCHNFEINDSYGDGIFYNEGGYYKLSDFDGNIISSSLDDSNGNFGHGEDVTFGCLETTIEPTLEPTTEPTLDPTPMTAPDSSSRCIENLTFFYKQKRVSCHWIGKNTKRMKRFCDIPLVKLNCPINCNICCGDHKGFRFNDWHGNVRGCGWAGENRKDYCNGYVLKFCPDSCSTCWE